MSITSVSATPAAPSLLAGTSTAASAASGFGATLQSAVAGQASNTTAIQSAHQTEPGRGVSGTGRHHRHYGGNNSMDTNGTQTASTQGGTAAGGAGQGASQTSGGLLLSDMMRGLQAYGATVPAG